MKTTIRNHVAAAYSILLVESADESQVLKDALTMEKTHVIYSYSSTGNLIEHARRFEDSYEGEAMDWSDLARFAAGSNGEDTPGRLIVVFDCHRFLETQYRAFLECAPAAKQNGNCLVMVAPDWKSRPPEMLHAAPILEFPLPDRDELAVPLEAMCEEHEIELNGNRDIIINAAKGLTIEEAENAYFLSVVETSQLTGNREIDHAIVAREKMRLIKGTGFLSVQEPVNPDQIGGLGRLKDYLVAAATMQNDMQLRKRGIIVAGGPGTGKSLVAKCSGAIYRCPILQFSIPEAKGSFVGQTEANVRLALKLAEAISPCILWLDECDKALGGIGNGESDGGTSLGMLGIILNWMQEHDKQILTVATCNHFHTLPDSFSRNGRIDRSFFVDTPGESERQEIAAIHFRRLGCKMDDFDSIMTLVASQTKNWVGSEIEACAKIAASANGRDVDAITVKKAIKEVIPMCESHAEQIEAQRSKLRRKLHPANSIEPLKHELGRKLVAAK